MDKRTAIERVRRIPVNNAGFTQAYQARAIYLLNNPNALNQGYYGTCGVAAAVRSLLERDPIKFARLLEAVFRSAAFNGTVIPLKGNTGVSVLLHQRQKMIAQKQSVTPNYNDTFDLDFIASRSLAKILKLKNPNLYAELKTLGDSFEAHYNIKPSQNDTARDQGDIAFNADSLRYLMSDVLQTNEFLSNSRPANVNANNDDIAQRIDDLNAVFDSPLRYPFAFAGVNGFPEFNNAFNGGSTRFQAAPTLMNVPNGRPRPQFEHVVVITGKITDTGAAYQVPVWTWANWKMLTVSKAYMSQYFPFFVFGYFKS